MFPKLIQNVKGNQQFFLMNNHPSNKNKRVAVKPPRNIEVRRQHDESISIMISEVNENHNSDNRPSNNNKNLLSNLVILITIKIMDALTKIVF